MFQGFEYRSTFFGCHSLSAWRYQLNLSANLWSRTHTYKVRRSLWLLKYICTSGCFRLSILSGWLIKRMPSTVFVIINPSTLGGFEEINFLDGIRKVLVLFCFRFIESLVPIENESYTCRSTITSNYSLISLINIHSPIFLSSFLASTLGDINL